MEYNIKWLKVLLDNLQTRYQDEPTPELMFSIVDVNKKLSQLLERMENHD